ncbi:MAG: PAS domain S-box protein [Sulfuritalea sp.]|jgi:PAS domain S-box-containing protein|nr:PAS domain S-box protein [Sulfuritalea sp.]
MKPIFPRKLNGNAEVRRIEMLFDRLPSSVVVALISIFLCFLVLFDSARLEILKAWTAYMLSVLALRVWIWYMFGKADRHSETIHRWEWLFAAGAFLTGVGWGALFGHLYPPAEHPDAQMFVALMVVITAFTGTVFLALSNTTFWLFSIPTLLPAIAYYAADLGRDAQWPVTAAACCIAVFIIVQRTLYQSATANLKRSTEAESLLAEQQAIFDSSPMGIVVIDNKQVVKCNARFGELLGRRIQELTNSRIDHHFASAEEAAKFIANSSSALDKGQVVQGMYRLRRADGSQFWAELSGRRMSRGEGRTVWMIADVTLRVVNDRRSQPREPQPRDSQPEAGVPRS